MAEVKVTKLNYEKELLQSDIPVLVDLWADWCGPCRMLSPILSEIAAEKEGELKIAKINVDEEPELAAAFQASSIPMLVVMKQGKVTNVSVGYIPKEQVLALL